MKLTRLREVNCEYTSYHPGRDPAIHRTTWPIGDILLALKERVDATEEDLDTIRSFNRHRTNLLDSSKQHTLSIATDTTHRHIASMADITPDPVNLYVFDLSSSNTAQPTAYLCLEHQLNQGVIDAFVTFDRQTASNLVSQRSVLELEEHFAMQMLIPDLRIQELLAQPEQFFSYLSSHELGSHIPEMSTNWDEVSHPAVVSTSPKSNISSVVVKSSSKLQSALKEFAGHNLVYREYVAGTYVIEVGVVAYRGNLTGMVCRLVEQLEGKLVPAEPSVTNFVDCEALNQIADIGSVSRNVLSILQYNGLGCMKFKIPSKSAQKALKSLGAIDDSGSNVWTATPAAGDDQAQSSNVKLISMAGVACEWLSERPAALQAVVLAYN